MSSSQSSQLPMNNNGDGNNQNENGNIDYTNNPDNDDRGDSDDGSEGNEDPEGYLDDDSGNVVPGILDESSDDDDHNEEHRSPRSRRRAFNSKSRSGRCRKCQQIKTKWNEEASELRAMLKEQRRDFKYQIKVLKEEIERLRLGNRIVYDPWDGQLSEFLGNFRQRDENSLDIDYITEHYHSIYKASCMQGNMSTKIKITHPDLDLEQEPYSRKQIQDYFNEQMLRDRYNEGPDDLNINFAFEDLPLNIQCRIWKMIIPNNELIHCLSRLDHLNPPLLGDADKVCFPNRFHIGNGPCCVAKADKPSRYLRYLLVSKRWYYVTAHLFYATNTFAFSSLGEFGRFCNGIGKPRVERLVHVELMWQGALTPRQPKGGSLRKQPLAWFLHTSRLRTLVIHIDETTKSYMRRPYEMMNLGDYYKDFGGGEYEGNEAEDLLDIFGMEVRRTDLQPNHRKYRSMRTVQGMDFLYQLRGMKWVRFYDTNEDHTRTWIHDWSFLRDLNSVATMKKTDSMALRTEIENLRPLPGLSEFRLSGEVRELVDSFYDDTPVDIVSEGGSETSSSSSSRDSGFSGLTTTASDSSSDSESDGGHGGSSRLPSDSRSDTYSSDMNIDVEEVDSCNEEGSTLQTLVVDMSETDSDSGRSSRSGFNKNNHNPDDSGLNTIITQPHVIVIEDDEDDYDNDKDRRTHYEEGYSTNSELFVRSHPRSSYGNGDKGGPIMRNSVPLIDLTVDSDYDNGTGNDGDEDQDIKSDDSFDDDNNDNKRKSITAEMLASQGPRDPLNPSNLSDERDSNMPPKRSRSEGDLG
ncbi:hypothetical protein GQX73_g8216 [Xylaria multiplex]|uniref:Uncharacterized protein n=1 Tax=Xylaria multiplex TaxID=323545 RepID=A0A7C8MI90_9PEZI|nr:hypothetical protein GQX73_g8216 [Xylaria multiplex]